MKVAVLTRLRDHFSLRIYRQNIVDELTAMGVNIFPFSEVEMIPKEAQLVWDPGLGMRRIPKILEKSHIPIVVTVHGLRTFSVPIRDLAKDWKGRIKEKVIKLVVARDWLRFKMKVSAIITVSEYGKREVIKALPVQPERIHSIHHGVNNNIFCPEGEKAHFGHRYLLHVSSLDSIKNIDRIFAGYALLPEHSRPKLVVISANSSDSNKPMDGIEFITKGLGSSELARWYRGAIGLVFPSLRETFGMPILEAMACGCPVITSNVSGCAEVAENAALLVNPRSVEEIRDAMESIIQDERLRTLLCQKGLVRAQNFTWRKSAEKHLEVFEKVLSRS